MTAAKAKLQARSDAASSWGGKDEAGDGQLREVRLREGVNINFISS